MGRPFRSTSSVPENVFSDRGCNQSADIDSSGENLALASIRWRNWWIKNGGVCLLWAGWYGFQLMLRIVWFFNVKKSRSGGHLFVNVHIIELQQVEWASFYVGIFLLMYSKQIYIDGPWNTAISYNSDISSRQKPRTSIEYRY